MKEKFEALAQKNESIEKKFSRKHFTVSVYRSVLFVIFASLLVFFIVEGEYGPLSIIGVSFPVIFGLLIKHHNKIALARDKANNIKQINLDEVKRLNADLLGFYKGDEFLIKDHFYAKDLDVFGDHSLFQLINRCTTPLGKEILADWLLSTSHKNEIERRQSSTKELSGSIDWRQNFQALGMLNVKNDSSGGLSSWLAKELRFKRPLFTKAVCFLLSSVTVLLIILCFLGSISFSVVLLMLLMNGLILGRHMKYAAEVTEDVSDSIELIKSYELMIREIEESDFSSEKLIELKSIIYSDVNKASKEIKQLKFALDYFYSRSNPFYQVLNLVFMADLHLLMFTEQWKKKNISKVNDWFNSVGEIEALSSIAAYHCANHETSYPKILDDEYVFSADELGHPLIKDSVRVTNDFQIKEKGFTVLITGSNMSGKSTFLRSIGVNMVLALSGAPVCAKNVCISNLQLFTSMRTEDNLDEGTSSFYAELKRIKQLLDLNKKPTKPVFYMLDEILKGTNSEDRNRGSKALIKQLSKTNSFGLVSTHDLELANLIDEQPKFSNKSFNSTIEGNEIHFDYKISEGACQSFNASKLMEKIGIEIE